MKKKYPKYISNQLSDIVQSIAKIKVSLNGEI